MPYERQCLRRSVSPPWVFTGKQAPARPRRGRLTSRSRGDYNVSSLEGSKTGAFLYVMGSSHKIDIGGLLAGGRQLLLVERRVAPGTVRDRDVPGAGPRAFRYAFVRGNAGDHRQRSTSEFIASVTDVWQTSIVRCTSTSTNKDVGPEVRESRSVRQSNVLTGDRLDVKDLTTQCRVQCHTARHAVRRRTARASARLRREQKHGRV